jgi:hypothetical protein
LAVVKSFLYKHISSSKSADCIILTKFTNIWIGLPDRIRAGDPYRLRGPLITFCQFFSSQLNPRFSQDHERDRFLIWGPTHHLMPFFTNISVLPTHYFIWGPTHHFLTFVTYISVLPTHYFIWGPTHHFLTFWRSELEAPLSSTK